MFKQGLYEVVVPSNLENLDQKMEPSVDVRESDIIEDPRNLTFDYLRIYEALPISSFILYMIFSSWL